jgi:hypothetical protein
MRAIQSCMPPSAQADLRGTFTAPPSASDLSSVERLIIDTRRRIVGVLDRELNQIRATWAVNQPESIQDELGMSLMEASPLPRNVVSVSRDLFISEAPEEVVLDPALEKATVDELNAALADAFNHVSAR